MLIYQWRGKGKVMMQGVQEYLILAEDIEDFKGEYPTEDDAITGWTAPGFELVHKYDTFLDNTFTGLPFNTELIVK